MALYRLFIELPSTGTDVSGPGKDVDIVGSTPVVSTCGADVVMLAALNDVISLIVVIPFVVTISFIDVISVTISVDTTVDPGVNIML